MNSLQQWIRCPDVIEVGDHERSVRLLKCGDLYAIRGDISQQLSSDVEMQLAGHDVSILRGAPATDAPPDLELLPVYAAARNSTPAVATNRVFLRLEEDTPIDNVRRNIEDLDFSITDIPAHAPHCAWLEPKSGHVDEALLNLDLLRGLPHAVNVEPQLLRPRAWKSPP